jgi:hypothetical protein
MKAIKMILVFSIGLIGALLLGWKLLYVSNTESFSLTLNGNPIVMKVVDRQKRFFGNHILGVGGGDYSTRIQWTHDLPKWKRDGSWRPILVYQKQDKALVILKRYYASPVPYEANALVAGQWKVLEKTSDYLSEPLSLSEVASLSEPLLAQVESDEKQAIQDWLLEGHYPKLWK